MKKFILLVLGSCLAISSCSGFNSTITSSSAALIGCPADLITIEDYKSGRIFATWTAKCDGKVFCCSKKNSKVTCFEYCYQPVED